MGRKKNQNPYIVGNHHCSKYINMSSIARLLTNSQHLRKSTPIPIKFEQDIRELLTFIQDWEKKVREKHKKFLG